MRRYRYVIYLKDKTKAEISILAEDGEEAMLRFHHLQDDPEFRKNITSKGITKMTVDFEGEPYEDTDTSRFDLRESDRDRDYYIALDRKNMIYIKFRRNAFVEVQEAVCLTDETPTAATVAESMRAISDFLYEHHRELL